MPHHRAQWFSQSSAGRVALGEGSHHSSFGGGNIVVSIKSASQPAQAVFSPDNTKQCTFLQALSITCRNQSAATDPGPHLITALHVLRRTNFYREGIPCRCTQQLARPCSISTTPPPFQLIMIPMSQIKHKSRAVLAHSTLTDVTPRSSLRLAESLTLDPAHGQSMHSNSTGSRRGCQPASMTSAWASHS